METQKQIRLWALLGPFTILLIFSAYLFKISPGQLYLPLVAIAGMILCWQGKIKGLILALFLLIGTLIYTMTSIPIEEKYWYIGLTMATALSFVVTTFSLEEIEQVLAKAQSDSDTRLDYISQLDEEKRKEEKKWEKLQVDLSWEKERNEELQKKIYAQKVAEKYTSDSFEPLYKQLRQQFEEKGEILHQTRKELFHVQEQATSLKKEMEEVTHFAHSDTIKSLEQEIVQMGQEMAQWETIYKQEIEDLQQLVTTLMEKK